MKINLFVWGVQRLARKRFPWLLCLLVGFASSALAQQDNRVCLYERPNFGGQSVCINAGENMGDLQRLSGGWNDRVASIRVFGNVQATIYEDAGFAGGSFSFENDIPNLAFLRGNELRAWRSEVSSIRVARRGTSGQAVSGQENRVCVYLQPNFGGRSICFNAGQEVGDFQTLPGGWNDKVASIRLFGNAQATIYEDAGFAGGSYLVNADIPNLARLRGNELRGWRSDVSSIRVGRRATSGQQDAVPENRVCVYAQPNFGGRSLCFSAGEDVGDFQALAGGWNDQVASIRLFGNAQATIYEDAGFAGGSYLVNADIPNLARLRGNELRGWRSDASSIRVERRRGEGQPVSVPGRPERGDRVCLYDQPNYAGQTVCFGARESSRELRLMADGWDNRAVSIRLFGDVQATVYENTAFGGASYVVSRDIPDLSQIRLGNTRGNFRQRISSIAVERSRGDATPTLSDAFRLGQQDFEQGRDQNYRAYRGSYDRSNETQFEREYNRGYDEARANRARDTSGGAAFRSLNGAYSGIGRLQIGNRSQQVTDVLVRLRSGGNARFELAADGQRLILGGTWVEGTRGQIEVTISEGLGAGGTAGRGRIYVRNGIFQRIELTGQTNRQNFLLDFREDDTGWGGGGWTPGGGRSGEVPAGATIHRGGIIGRGSGKGLDVADVSTDNGASIQQWDYSRQPNQTWQVIDVGSGEVAIIAVHSNKAITVQGGRDLNGANVVQREWRNNPYQRWRLEQVAGGLFRIINVGSGKSLDVAGQSTANGANIQQWDYANQQNQQWRLER